MSYTVGTYISAAGETLAPGYAVNDDGSATTLVDGGANQAACQQLPVRGITVSASISGEKPEVAVEGAEIPYVSSGATAVGDKLVCKFGAGSLMKWANPVSGDVIVGICVVAAADGATGRLRFVGHSIL